MGKLKDIEIQAWVRAGKPIAGKSDGDGLTFTLSAMDGRDFAIPLPAAAVAWLLEIRRTSVASEYVFPARRRMGKPTMSPATLNWAMGEIKHGLEHFTLHDLRRTARMHLARLGVAPHVAERCLKNHKLPGINDTYGTHDYLAERRQALNAWADLLVRLDRGETGKVMPIKAVLA